MEELDMEERQARPPTLGTYPWLVCSQYGGYQTFCPILDPNRICHKMVPELYNKNFWTSCYGWSLLSNYDDRIFFLWNPVTFEKIRLPSLNYQISIRHCTLSSPPNNPTCMILFFACYLPSIIYCHLGDEQWTEIKYEDELKRCFQESEEWDDDNKETQISNPFICNGNIYALSFKSGRVLLIHEIKQDSIGIRSLHVRYPTGHPHAIHFRKCLVEYCGEVYGIRILFGGIGYNEVVAVELYRLDFSQMVWEKLESVKDFAFFANYYCSVCCLAIKPEIEENHVYFTSDEGQNLYSYNTEDGSLFVSKPFPNLPRPPSSSFGLVPDHRKLITLTS